MKKLLSFVVLCAVSCAMSLAQVSNDNEDGVYKVNKNASRWKEGEVIIKFKDDSGIQTTASAKGRRTVSTKRKVSAVLNNLGLEEMEQLMPLTGDKVSSVRRRVKSGRMVQDTDLSKLVVAKFDKSKASVNEAIEQLKALDEVEFAEPNYIVTVCSTDDGSTTYDDPLMSDQWGVNAINIQPLWAMPKQETRRPVIAILDTGVDINHPDLAANIWTNPLEADGEEFADDDNNGYYDDLHGWDFINNTAIINNGMDGNGHGTHCAGIAAAVGNNGIGVVGANPDAYILPIKVMGDNGSGTLSTIINGIDYAIAAGADVLSMSLGAAYSLALEQSLLKAYAKYIVCVGAAGNSSADINNESVSIPSPTFPGAFDFVIGVMATQEDGNLAGFSNYDPDGPFFSTYPSRHNNNADFWNYEVKAPGSNIMSTYPGGKYKKLNGTSMACPMVAGAISRILQVRGYDYAKDYGLYGDIAESKNSVGIFDAQKATTWTEDNRNVALRLLSVRVDDSVFGNGDGVLDAGEIVDLYPTVRSLWGYAKNIKVRGYIKNENISNNAVEYLQDEVDFGMVLNSRGMGECANPIRVKLNNSINDNYNLLLYFNITCDDLPEEEQNNEQEVGYKVNNGVKIGGVMSEDMTLYSGVHYIVDKLFAIPEGKTLTIKPGVTIRFRENSGLKCEGNIICIGKPDSMVVFTSDDNYGAQVNIREFDFGIVDISYTRFERMKIASKMKSTIHMRDCVISDCSIGTIFSWDYYILYERCNILNNVSSNMYDKTNIGFLNKYEEDAVRYCNIINNRDKGRDTQQFLPYGCLNQCNSMNNYWGQYGPLSASFDCNYIFFYTLNEDYNLYTNYLGSAKEFIQKSSVMSMDYEPYPVGYGTIDYKYVMQEPSTEAHGIVWKVVVDGYDAQDEFESLPPLGIGKHKFEVYFNRPMDINTTPKITMGLISPYTQKEISEDGEWNEECTIYTAYLNITGKSNTDGLNQIVVSGAKDNEFFDVPEENTRFKVLVQSVGSMSTGLFAEAGMGKVKLTWETDEESFADLMGYNVYRYNDKKETYSEWGYNENGEWGYWEKTRIVQDTIMVNTSLIEPNETEFTDYDVVPGTTYYYLIKEIGTDLVQHDVSNVVAATPLTATKGDANGSMSVDIADVVTEVAYLTDQNPQPFIFDAADVNEDQTVNILDVVGTVNIIMSPSVTSQSVDNTVTYTIEDGILYVESTTPLGGVQVSVNADANEQPLFTTLEGLDGMEHAGTWLNDNEYMLLAYSMSGKTIATGKQPLLQIGDKEVKNMIVSDARGRNLVAINGTATSIEELPFGIDECENAEVRYFDTTGRAVSASAATKKGVYIVGMYVDGKCVKSYKLLNR